jgi:hypothetical protein
LLSAIATLLVAPATPFAVLAQSSASDELRGANYVYARPAARSRTSSNRARYRKRAGRLPSADVADARIGVTLWRADPSRATGRSSTRDIVQVGSETKSWSLVRVGSDTELATGDLFRVGIETLRSGYLYVINRPIRADGTTGDPYLVFPTRRIRGGDNSVVAGRMVMIPTPPDEPPFQTTDPYGDVVGEELIILVTPSPIDIETREDRYRVPAELPESWITEWGAPTETFELVGGAGAAYTRVERAAATNPARLLTPSEPLPQIVHMLAAKPGSPMLARALLRVRRTLASP